MQENRIYLLDTLTANQIAAGEVVERPLSVVKELVENAIDAASTRIEVKIFDAALEKIQVADNGIGMNPADMRLSVQRHATSKIRSLSDLDNLFTLGFRGEALPSIAAVSQMTIISKQAHEELGYKLKVEAGRPGLPEQVGSRNGTVVLVERLFYNAPARKKFLKTPRWELGLVSDCLQKLAMAHPHIVFKLSHCGKILFSSEGGDLARAVLAVYGAETLEKLVALDYTGQGVVISGFASLPELNRADRNHYNFFVNSRWVKSRELLSMVDEAYRTLLPQRRYPLMVLDLRLPQENIDVNVHPAKLEIKFAQPLLIREAVRVALHQALLRQEALAPRLSSPPVGHSQLSIDNKQGFWRLEEGKVPRLHQSLAPSLDGMDLAQRLYAPGSSAPPTPPIIEQRLDFNVNVLPGKLLYADLHILGQVGSSFIVVAGEKGLYLIDQHAAHERVLYERILAASREACGESHMLAIPQSLTLTAQEHILLAEGILHLDELGFILEHFGENTYIIRGVPLWYEGGEPETLLRGLLAELAEQKGDPGALRRGEIFMAACKQAVKANRRLEPGDISALLKDLDNCENPSTCPHGRPVAITITFAEIRKRFLRNSI